MNDETRHVDYPRSAIIVFRFSFVLANFQDKRHTLIRVRLHGLACAPRATLSLQAFAHGEAGRLFRTTGISLQSISSNPFHFVTIGTMVKQRELYNNFSLSSQPPSARPCPAPRGG